jgi:6-phosphogluconolactonase
MAAPAEVVVHRDAGLLAHAAAARLVTRLLDAQSAHGSASLVLTGGGIGIALLRAVLDCPAAGAVDWAELDVYWGDERFVPADSADRNERQAREALLDHVPVDATRVFPMGYLAAPRAGGDREVAGPGYADVETATAEYTALLGARAAEAAVVAGSPSAPGTPAAATPAFDVLLLGLGPEGHVASIFPSSPAAHATEPVVAVHNCPKPPPTRISLSLPAIQRAKEVWVVAAGTAKAEAAALALSGDSPLHIPAASAVGTDRTLWLLDRAAASRLPTPPVTRTNYPISKRP